MLSLYQLVSCWIANKFTYTWYWMCGLGNISLFLRASLVAQMVKNPATIDPGSILGLGRSRGGGNSNSLQYSCLENSMDRGAWWATVHGVEKSGTWLSDFSLVAQRLKCLPGMQETRVRSLGQEDPLEKEMATYSSTLAWRIPWREEPGRLQSMGATSLSLSSPVGV